jgi:hypothetical protein
MTMGRMQSLNYPQRRRMANVALNGFRVIRVISLPQVPRMTLFIPIEPGVAGSQSGCAVTCA